MPARDHRDAVADVEEGDLVDVATDYYDYTNPLTVTSVHSREVWETPAGPDILVASLKLDGARTTYAARYNGGEGTFTLESSSVTHEITRFSLVTEEPDDDDDDEPAGDDAEAEDVDEDDQDDEEDSSVSWESSSSDADEESSDTDDDVEASADGGTTAKYSTGSVDLDPAEHTPDEDDSSDASGKWDMPFPVPDGITRQQVRSAVKGSLSLQGVLESLDWPEDERARDRVRALVFDLGFYQELVEPESWDREQARKRGWQ
jgi:hypothetical protein